MKINYSDIYKYNIVDEADFESDFTEERKEPKITVPEFDPLNFDVDHTYGNGLCSISRCCKAKLTEAGNYRKIVVSSNSSSGTALRKIRHLPNNQYVNTETGEIKSRQKREKRIETISCLNQSINQVKLLIYANFVDVDGYFITLAYDSYMPDYQKAQKDFGKFMDKLKYFYKSRYNIEFVFLKVIEPKESGSWHFHLLIKSATGGRFKITEEYVRSIWKQQSVRVEPITDGEGLAAYLGNGTCTYTDDDNFNIAMLNNSKYTCNRRAFYESGMRLYSKSQNLTLPKETFMTQDEAHEAVANCKKISENHVLVTKRTPNSEYILNAVNYETYKKES